MKNLFDIHRVFIHNHFYYLRLILPTLLLIPVMLCSCTEEKSEAISFAGPSVPEIAKTSGVGYVDVFVYNDDVLKRIDAYQRIPCGPGETIPVFSQQGNKIYFLYRNPQSSDYNWNNFNSLSALEDNTVNLESECPGNFSATAMCRLKAGGNGSAVCMPFVCEVYLRSLAFDFRGRAYAGCKISNLKVYLINVSAECPLLAGDTYMPTRIINTGRLTDDDMDKFNEAGLVLRKLDDMDDGARIFPDVKLYCYANGSTEESPGSSFTRLVIEAEIEEEKYYWPINVGGDIGMKRAARYVYDVKINRKGTADPDVVAETGNVEFTCEIEKWKEKGEYVVGF